MAQQSSDTTSDRPYKPVEEVSNDRFEDVLLPEGRPPASITDIQYLYGQFMLIGQELSVEHSLTPDHKSALTLQEAAGFVGEEQAVVYVDIELDEESETLTPTGATVTNLTQWHLEKTAFSYYDAKRGVDHSITQRTGKSTSPAKVATSQLEKATRRWANEDSIAPLVDEHEDGWLISELQSLHAHDNMDEITTQLEDQLTGSQYRLISVRFYTGAEPTQKDEWAYPADMGVLLDAMDARRSHKWATKNSCDSAGEATGYVQSDQSETVYGMGTDPLSLYTGKKRAWMPYLNRDESAGNHPISDTVTKKIAASSPLLEACSQPHGLSLYHFPYFAGEQTVEKLQWLYQLLWETYLDRQQHEADSDEEGDTPTWNTIENFYKACRTAEIPDHLTESLSVWTVAIQNYQSDRKRALAEIKQGGVPAYVALATTASEVAGEIGDSALFETYEWDFATPDSNFMSLVTSPQYFFNTTVTTTDEDDVDANHPGYRFYRQLLAGEKLSVSELLKAYTEEINTRYRDNLENGADYPVPSYRIIQQFAQLCVLERSDALDIDLPVGGNTTLNDNNSDRNSENSLDKLYRIPSNIGVGSDTDTTTTMTSNENTTDISRAEAEQQAYRTMINEQPVLAESPARRAIFTLGSLVTTVSGHQRGRDVQPLNAKMSPSSISKHSFKENVGKVFELINRYAATDNKQWRYTAQTSQLTEDVTEHPPEEWTLSTSEVQYFFSLGMAFGAEQHTPTESDAPEQDSTPQSESA